MTIEEKLARINEICETDEFMFGENGEALYMELTRLLEEVGLKNLVPWVGNSEDF